MGLSNAERQRLHRQRVKERLASGGGIDEPAHRLRQECIEVIGNVAKESDEPGYSMLDLLGDFLDEPRAFCEVFGPRLAEILGLPPDPWVGLTMDDLGRMIKGRTREAARLGITYHRGIELSFMMKLRAARHRRWLEGGAQN